MMMKEAVNRAEATTFAGVLRFERRVVHAMVATEDQKKGMAPVVEQRKPAFNDR